MKVKKFLAGFLSAMMVVSLLPSTAFATEIDTSDNGSGGESVIAEHEHDFETDAPVLSEDGTMLIYTCAVEDCDETYEEEYVPDTPTVMSENGDDNADASNSESDPQNNEDSNGNSGVEETSYVAKIGENGYKTLEEAIQEANSGDTITIMKNFETNTSFVLSKTITIDGGGYTITSTSDRVFTTYVSDNVETKGDITLKNLNVNSNSSDSNIRVFNVYHFEGTVTVSNCTFTAIENTLKHDNYGINVAGGDQNLKLVVENTKITAYQCVNIYGTNRTVSIDKCKFNSVNQHNERYTGGCVTVFENAAANVTISNTSMSVSGGEGYPVGKAVSTGSALGVAAGNSISISDCYVDGIKMTATDGNVSVDSPNVAVTVDGEQVPLPDIYYYREDSTGYSGSYLYFKTPFESGYLMDGEYIRLMNHVKLTSDIVFSTQEGAIAQTGGCFTLTFGEYSIDKGDYTFVLPENVSVVTDVQVSDLFDAPAGCNIVEASSGESGFTYSVAKSEHIASVIDAQGNETNYSTLAEAVNAAETGKTVKLLANVNEDITIAADQNITLDLNGKRLTNVSGHTITNNGTLTITDSSAGTVGTVDNVTHAKAAIYNTENATCTILAGKFTRSKENGQSGEDNGGNSFYTINNYGSMTIGSEGGENDITVTANGHYSSLVHNGWQSSSDAAGKKAEMTIYGGTFTGGINTIKNDESGHLKIKDGTFTNVTQYALQNWNVAEINGGTFESNTSSAVYNGADAETSVGELTITRGTFTAPANHYVVYNVTSTGAATEITGGIYSSQYYTNKNSALNYTSEENTDNTYSVVMCDESNSVASIIVDGKTIYYPSLENAVTAGQTSGAVVTLLKDIALSNAVTVSGTVTLDLNGHSITRGNGNTTSALIVVSDNGKLIVTDNTEAKEGKIESSNFTSDEKTYAGIGIRNNSGSVDIQSGTVSGYYGVYNSGGEVDIKGGTVTGTDTGIVTLGGKVNVNGGKVTGTGSSGAGISLFNLNYDNESEAAVCTISGGEVSGTVYGVSCNNLYSGGTPGCQLNITGGTISSDFCAIYWPNNGKVTVGSQNDTTDGPTITGKKQGILICCGELEVNSGTVSCTSTAETNLTCDETNSETADNFLWAFRKYSGACGMGDAITVVQNRSTGYAASPVKVTINGGSIKGGGNNYSLRVFDCNQATNATQLKQDTTVSVAGGTFTGSLDLDYAVDSKVISSGTFSALVPLVYCADGYIPVNAEEEGMYSVEGGDYYVAILNDDGTYTGYTEFLSAVLNSKVQDGRTVVMLKDWNYSAFMPTIKNSITFDLNGHTLTGTHTSNAAFKVEKTSTPRVTVTIKNGSIVSTGSDALRIGRNADVTLENVTLTGKTYGITAGNDGVVSQPSVTVVGSDTVIYGGTAGIAVYSKSASTEGTKLTIKDGTISGGTYGIAGNGSLTHSNAYMSINIEGGTITSEAENAAAIYHPHVGTLTITGGTIIGATGIEMRAGTLNVAADENGDGPVITGTSETFSCTSNGSGTTTVGAGIAIVEHTTNLGVTANISGGTISGYYALYQEDIENSDASDVEISISGGNFFGTNAEKDALYSEDCIGIVSGGNFSSVVPIEYCASGYVSTTTTDDNNMYTVTEAAPKVYGRTLSLDGTIGVNYYVDMSKIAEENRADYRMKFTVSGSDTYADYDATAYRTFGGNPYYRFTCPVAAKQMTDTITAQIVTTNGDAVSKEYTYSVRTYYDNMKNTGDESLTTLLEAMLHYGSYAQQYFGYNTDNLADAGLKAMDSVTADQLEAYKSTIEGTLPSDITGITATLTLESSTVIRYYIHGNISGYTFQVNGKGYTPIANAGGNSDSSADYYIEIPDVTVRELDTMYELAIVSSDGEQVYKLTYGALTYAYNKLESETAEANLKNTMKAMFLYNKAAEAYAGWLKN